MPSLRLFRASVLVALAVFIGGCGSILSSSEITSAADALARAESLEAEQLAIYEYVSAEAYLEKAREEWGRSDFQKSVEYARRAQEFAIQAYERAMRHPGRNAGPVDPELEALDALTP